MTMFKLVTRINPNYFIFVTLVLAIVAKCILFQFLVFETLNLDSAVSIFKFYGTVLAISIFLSSFVFISKHHWWTIVLLLLIDLWELANLTYYRANGVFINMDAILMADNMDGFWTSVITYFSWKSYLPFLISIIYVVIVYFVPSSSKRQWKWFITCIVLFYLFFPVRQFKTWHNNIDNLKIESTNTGIKYILEIYTPLFTPYKSVLGKAYVSYISGSKAQWEEKYIREASIVDYFFAMIWFEAAYIYHQNRNILNEKQVLTQEDKIVLSNCLQSIGINKPNTNLIIILVESLESWGIEYQWDGVYAMPCLRNLLQNEHIFYADKIKSQVKHGVSGDGQMIVNTGLLPISSGAACRIYGDNTYPNIAHYYQTSITLNPSAGAWNQSVVNPNYGISELYESSDMRNDISVFQKLNERLEEYSQSEFIMAITVSTHTPFSLAKEVDYKTDKDMPDILSNYIKCLNYTDEQMGKFLDEFLSSPLWYKSTTLVITGDHTIFKQMLLDEFKDYASENNLLIKNGKNYCPLIIFSPNIKEPIKCVDECYQMDIFPTIINVIGCGDYYWKGLGINLTDSSRVRIISEQQAYELSDKLIRTNYFDSLYE